MNFLVVMAIQPTLDSFLSMYGLLFILSIVTLTFAIMLRSWLLFLTQLIVLIASVLLSDMTIAFIFITIQILLTIYLLYRIKQAIDYNYHLVSEKIHRAPRNITATGNDGTKKVF